MGLVGDAEFKPLTWFRRDTPGSVDLESGVGELRTAVVVAGLN